MTRAYASAVIDAPATTVWACIRDFGTLDQWHPSIVECEIEDGEAGDQVSAVRAFTLTDGAFIRERLLAFSDTEMKMVYNFETTPFAVTDYEATIKCTAVTADDRCFIEWLATFDCDLADRAGWIDTFTTGVFRVGFDALTDRLGPEQEQEQAQENESS